MQEVLTQLNSELTESDAMKTIADRLRNCIVFMKVMLE